MINKTPRLRDFCFFETFQKTDLNNIVAHTGVFIEVAINNILTSINPFLNPIFKPGTISLI